MTKEEMEREINEDVKALAAKYPEHQIVLVASNPRGHTFVKGASKNMAPLAHPIYNWIRVLNLACILLTNKVASTIHFPSDTLNN